MTSPFPYRPYTKYWRALAVAAALYLLLAAIGALTLPGFLKRTLEQQIPAQLGRQFSVESVSFNPFTLRVSLHHLQLMEADNTTPAVSAELLALRPSLLSVLHLAPVIGAVELDQLHVRLERSRRDGKELNNFSDIIARLANKPASGGDPVRFAVSNIELKDGAIDVDDRVVGKKVVIDAIQLGIPFISNFTSKQDVYVQPHLSARVDGSQFELKGRSKPFDASLDSSIAIEIDHFNLADIAALAPDLLPFKVKKAFVTTQLTLNFDAQKDQQRLALTGSAELNDLDLVAHDRAPLLAVRSVHVDLKDADMIGHHVEINALDVTEPTVWAALNEQGGLNWLSVPNGRAPAGQPARPDKASGQPFTVSLERLQVHNGTLHWRDAANAEPAAEITLAEIGLDVAHLSTDPKAKPATVKFSAGAGHLLSFDGSLQAGSQQVAGELALEGLSLHDFQPYANRLADAALDGHFSLHTQVDVKGGEFALKDLSAELADLSLQANNKSSGGLAAAKIAISAVTVDGAQHSVKVGKVALDRVSGNLSRDTDGAISVSKLMKRPVASHATAPADAGKPPHATVPWRVDVDEIGVTASSVSFADQAVQPAVSIKADPVDIKVTHVSSAFDQPMQLALRATLNKTGQFAVDGSGTPKAMQMNLNVQNFAVQALQPYFTEFLNIQIGKGSVSTQGSLKWTAPSEVAFQGGLKVANLVTFDKVNGDDFVKWKALDVTGINVDVGGAANSVALGSISLSDFYARAILSEKGQLNLQDILVHKAKDAAAPAGAAAPAKPVPATLINIGQITLSNGLVNYTDNFIKPHYSMRMTGMGGSIGAIRSDQPVAAPININGKVDDEAPVAISGSLNPLFSPLLLDIRMTADGIDLPGLTMYSLKYAGYPIVQGKLSLDVAYHIKDNQLDASNSLKIEELTFGDQVDGPDAKHLPIPFLVSLLTDSNGQIALDLPISGSINDPQFSIAGLIGKVFMDVIEKVITSPFTLLAHAFGHAGGSDELSYVEFAPGSAHLTDAGKTKLNNLANALQQRPALQLNVRGRADMQADADGLRHHLLNAQIRRVRSLNVDDEDAPVTAAERASAIAQIYSSATFVKPKNVIGLSKSLPAAEMEQLILANTTVADDDIRALALRRETAVVNYLTDVAHIPVTRLFSIAPRLNAEGIQDKGAVSRVDFDLKTE